MSARKNRTGAGRKRHRRIVFVRIERSAWGNAAPRNTDKCSFDVVNVWWRDRRRFLSSTSSPGYVVITLGRSGWTSGSAGHIFKPAVPWSREICGPVPATSTDRQRASKTIDELTTDGLMTDKRRETSDKRGRAFNANDTMTDWRLRCCGRWYAIYTAYHARGCSVTNSSNFFIRVNHSTREYLSCMFLIFTIANGDTDPSPSHTPPRHRRRRDSW